MTFHACSINSFCDFVHNYDEEGGEYGAIVEKVVTTSKEEKLEEDEVPFHSSKGCTIEGVIIDI